MDNQQALNFKARDIDYEIFFAEDGAIELYEKDNPKEGMFFTDKKHLLMFVNTLTDVLEKVEMETV